MVPSFFHRSISIFLILVQIFPIAPLTAYEGVQGIADMSESQGAINELIQEREKYSREHADLNMVISFSSDSEFLGSSYVIERSSRMTGEVGNRIVTSDLLYNTLIRNMSDTSLDPSSLGVHATTAEVQSLAQKKFNTSKSTDTKDRVITFEFGIPGNHLIFSKPVLLSVDAGDIPDGSPVDLLVHHAGESDYGTSGLMTDPSGECLPDGTATRPAKQARVTGSKVSFYTCGASTFALGYVPMWDYPNTTVYTVSPTVDNQVILGGAFVTVGGTTRNRVARVSKEGFLDASFDPNVNNIVYASAIQSDDKILIGGTFTTVGGVTRNRIARLNSDGTLDTSFNPNVSAGTQVRAIKLQSDGKILIGGTFTTVGGQTRNNIARLNTDGTVDTGFNPNANNIVYTIAIQSDGNILIGGTFTTITGTARNRIARVSSTGTLDATFNPNANSTVWDIAIQSDGSIIFGGAFTSVGATARNRIARVSIIGALDGAFNPNVSGGTPVIYSILIENSGNIIFGGTFTTVTGGTRNRLARYSSAGVLDTTFNPNAGNTVFAIGVRTDGMIVVGGSFTTLFGFAIRYIGYINPIGTQDTTYNLSISSTVYTVSSTADNQVILGGAFVTVGGITRNRIARVSTGGSLDTSFDPNVNNIVYASAIQSDGKIIIGGAFSTVGGVTRNRIARLNADGTLDSGFNPNISAGTQVRVIKIQSDGKILIGGNFTAVGGVARNRIARLNTDGTIDTGFNPNANNIVYAIAIQTDGKILIGGTFTTVGGTTRNRIARVTATGTLDATFNPNASSTVWDIAIQTDGSIVFGGAFATIGGVTRNRIARINPTGVLDGTFNPNVSGGTAVVYTILIEDSGDIIFGGTFTTVTGGTRNRLARYSSAGALDATLNPNAGNTVFALAKDQDLNLLAGGAFTTMGPKATRYFSWIGLNVDVVPPQILSISLLSGAILPIGSFVVTTTHTDAGVGVKPASTVVTLERWNATAWGADIAPSSLSGTPSLTTTTSIHTFAGVPFGKYRFRISVSDMVGNTSVLERIFYIDALEWSASKPSVDIGNVVGNIQKNSFPDELVITVQTIGAPFRLTLSGSELGSLGTLVPHWSAGSGFGYEKYNGAYSGTLSSLAGGALIMNQPQNINGNGDRYTYTYRVQFGTRIGTEQPAGEYTAPISLQLVTGY